MRPVSTPHRPRSVHAGPATAFLLALLLLPSVVPAAGLDYPETRKVDQVDVYHGVQVADPYRWLEEDVRTSPAVADWVEAQNRVTSGFLDSIPERDALRQRLTRLWDYDKFMPPVKRGGRWFFEAADGLQDHRVVHVQDSLAGEPRVLLDPNTWSDDGTVALAGLSVAPDGRHAAYGVAEAGSDWTTWRVVDVASGETLADEIRWTKWNQPAWTADGKGFFYGRYPAPEEAADTFLRAATGYALYYHRLGTPQEKDVLVYQRPDQPTRIYAPHVTDDGRWLILRVSESSSGNGIWVRDLHDPYAAPVPLIEDLEQEWQLVYGEGTVLYFHTDDGAPRGRVVALDVEKPEREHWREVIPEGEDTLRRTSVVGSLFHALYMRDARTAVRVFTLDGEPVREVELPGIGSAWGFEGEPDDTQTFFVYSSFNQPGTVYRHDTVTGESTVWRRPDLDVDPDAYTVEQVFYTSRDGTRVPLFLAYKKGLEKDGDNPTLLYGYGGFGVPMSPRFSVERLAWMEQGGVFALAGLRGGGEYGEDWHEAGTKLDKQNVFDDFIAAAEHLVEEGWTSPRRLAIAGGSNGGLLVGAAMTQRPDLFGAALPAVGVMDMLRFHLFTAGRFWVGDYGSSEDPEEFRALHAYSPYHNLDPADYPATLVTTADTDDRVVPGHSFKFAARLQEVHRGDDPVLIRIEERAGHGAGKPTSKRIEEATDELAFLVHVLDLDLDLDLDPAAGG